MTSTKDDETSIAGLAVVLKSLQYSTQTVPLTDWLADLASSPVWVPLIPRNGITKVMPVSQLCSHSILVQSICQQMSWNTTLEWQGKPYELAGIEVDTHDLHILQIPLFPVKSLPPSMGRAIHALFFQWMSAADPILAEQLHQQHQLPFTLSLSPGSRPKLRISLLQKQLLTPLLLGLDKALGTEIHLADVPCQVGHAIDMIQTNYFKQLAQTTPQEVIELRFLSPTSFKQGRLVQPFPLPELVFAGLLRRWNLFAPEALHFPSVTWQGLVSAFNLKTHALKMEGGAEIGSVGWVRYRFPDPEQAKIAAILAHFACFAGVGRKTTMGMGQVQNKCHRVDPSFEYPE
jgi:CRISPR-associated endoribonuclease Cas6